MSAPCLVGILVEIDAHIVELVLYFVVRYGVRLIVNLVFEVVGFACGVFVRPNVRAVADIYGIVAVVKLVARNAVCVGIVIVIRRHISDLHRYAYGLAHTRLNYIRFFKSAQYYVGLFDFSVGIGRRIIHLHNLFARNVTRVGNGDVRLDCPVFIQSLC